MQLRQVITIIIIIIVIITIIVIINIINIKGKPAGPSWCLNEICQLAFQPPSLSLNSVLLAFLVEE